MNRNIWRVSICLGLILIVALTIYWSWPTEPVYEGKSLTVWIHEFRFRPSDGSKDFWVRNNLRREKAKAVIRNMGVAAVPSLRRRLRYHDSGLKELLLTWLGPKKSANLNLESEYWYNWDGIAGSDALGPQAAPIARDVARFLTNNDSSLRLNCADALGSIGTGAREVVPQMLAAAVWNKDAMFREKVFFALAQIGADPQTAGPVLTGFLSDSEERTRGEALATLVAIHSNKVAMVPLITERLRDPSRYVRSEALVQLTTIGTGANAALPAVSPLLTDGDPSVRRLAAACYAALGGDLKSVATKPQEKPEYDFNFVNSSILSVLSEYADLRGQSVERGSNLDMRRMFTIKTAARVTKSEAIAMFEKAMRDKNVVIVTNSAGKLLATETNLNAFGNP